jgi:hypothetical protein
VRSINSAYDESAPTVSCSISMKMHIKTLFWNMYVVTLSIDYWMIWLYDKTIP